MLCVCAYSGSKECTSPDCSGYLISTLQDRRRAKTGEAVPVKCGTCHSSSCWTCYSCVHPSRSCEQARHARRQWMGFLKQTRTDGEGGAGALLLKLEQSAANAHYFRKNIESGNMKRCPQCKKLIEKMMGCNTMVSTRHVPIYQ
jgi:hypothetical protein